MYVQKKNKKGFLEIGLEGSVGILSKMNFSFEFFQSVHSIILKVNLSAGLWFRTTVRGLDVSVDESSVITRALVPKRAPPATKRAPSIGVGNIGRSSFGSRNFGSSPCSDLRLEGYTRRLFSIRVS